MAKHQNNGSCDKCIEIKNKFPGFYAPLWEWFANFQVDHPEAHISCAGRGKAEQEDAFRKKSSRAHFGQSAHNYNCALDLFCMIPQKDIYDRDWFNKVLAKNLPSFVTWYGAPKSSFFELPHIEVSEWKKLKDEGKIKLVE